MALDTTVGGANSDSYASVAEADAYNAGRPFATSWANLSTDGKEDALRQACQLLDACFAWTGAAAGETQALCWPRTGMKSRNGFAIASDANPKALKDAQSEWARQLAAKDLAKSDAATAAGIAGIKAGPVDIRFKEQRSDSLALRDADVIARGPEFLWMSRMVPDAVRALLPGSWYTRANVSRPLMFEANGGGEDTDQ